MTASFVVLKKLLGQPRRIEDAFTPKGKAGLADMLTQFDGRAKMRPYTHLAGVLSAQQNRRSTDKVAGVDRQPGRAQCLHYGFTPAKIAGVLPDHGKVLRASENCALNQRQNPIKVKPVHRTQRPSERIGGFHQRKGCAGFENTGQLTGKDAVLFRVEGFQSKRLNCEISRFVGQIGVEHICTQMLNSVTARSMQTVHGLGVHSGADVDRGDLLNIGKPTQQMGPDLARARHQIHARCGGLAGQIQCGHTLSPPAHHHSERGDAAPAAIAGRTLVEDIGDKGRIINIVTHVGTVDHTPCGSKETHHV